MSDQTTSNDSGQGDGSSNQRPSSSISGHMTSNKTETVLWLTRLATIVFTFLYIIPVLGHSTSFYQRAVISSAATSALRLHQRLPNFQFNRQFFALLFLEDSCHYLIYAILFLGSNPITMALMPIFLFALLHAKSYTKTLLTYLGQGRLTLIHNLISKLETQQVMMLRLIACAEIFLMPAIIFMMFTGHCSLFLPFIYYRFITLRYASRRNPYSRAVFYELRVSVESLVSQPQCPAFIRNISYRAIGFISNLAPQVATS